MVDARAFDAATIGEEDGGKVRVILPQEVGHLAKEVQCLDDNISNYRAKFFPVFLGIRRRFLYVLPKIV